MTQVETSVFRKYDIRGTVAGDNIQLTPELARLVGKALGTYLPRQLQYRQPNKIQVLWDFPPGGVQVNQKMDQRWFDKPEPPPGWKLVTVRPEADAPPKIYRNSGTP